MTPGINDLITYPEIQTYTLINNFTGQEVVVTEGMLKTAFPREMELMRIKSGRHKAWTLIENFTNPNALLNL